jgi:argininosuccinate lyase
MSRDDEQPLWAGRFGKPPAPEAQALGASLSFDLRLAAQDVEASIAHVRGLEEAGLLAPDEASALEDALREVQTAIADGVFDLHPSDEDVHSAIERGVTERLGDLGARLHAGRSRNDLVVADLRLWLLAARRRIDGLTGLLVRALIDRARQHAATVMPGTTHARLAQPVTLGHHLLAHAWGLVRDLERFAEWRDRTAVSPLGAGALATTTLPLRPDAIARRLGFDRAFSNSIDAVSDRDFVLEFCADAAILGMHLSRLAADLARWTDEGIAWAQLDEAYSTGSSMMPQKRNPDVAELVRAKAARPSSDFARVAAMLQGLPLGYHRDLQEDKEAAFDAADTLEACLAATVGAVETVRFDQPAMRAAAEQESLYATDLAEALVLAGVPFREAHRRTGALLKSLEEDGRSLRDLSPEEWTSFGVVDGPAHLDPDRAVAARGGPGGPSSESVLAQATAIERALGG